MSDHSGEDKPMSETHAAVLPVIVETAQPHRLTIMAERTIFAATLGEALEFYDFTAYGVFAVSSWPSGRRIWRRTSRPSGPSATCSKATSRWTEAATTTCCGTPSRCSPRVAP